jgi:hypothetical protein
LALAIARAGVVVSSGWPSWRRKPVRRDLMPPSQVSAQDIETARAAIVLVIAGIMIFWRFALRLMLAIGVVAVGLGLLVLLQNMHR